MSIFIKVQLDGPEAAPCWVRVIGVKSDILNFKFPRAIDFGSCDWLIEIVRDAFRLAG